MDKLTFAKTHYNNGYRAYYRDGGLVFTHPKHYPQYASDPEYWHALRAYQDAERKKGVPIHFEWGMEKKWPGFEVCGISRGHNYLMPAILVNPVYEEDGSCYVATGQFTNFRWRAGYPKAVHCQGDNCPSQHSCLNGCMYPKGGNND